MEIQKNYSFDEFIREMTEAVERAKTDEEKVTLAEPLLGKLVQSASWLPPEKQTPNDKGYARHSLYHDPHDRFEVIALVWQPGQRTPLHDHDGTWGVEGVLCGQIKATNYLQVGRISDDTVKLRYTDTVIINEQATGQLLPPADCHILEVEGLQTAITVHVYGKKLQKFLIFDKSSNEDVYVTHEHHVNYM